MRPQIALVDGTADVRHARQLMLRAEGYDVRAYANAAPLLTDPRVRPQACIVAGFAMPQLGGVALLHAMRSRGWHGAAILLAEKSTPELATLSADQHFTLVTPTELGDRSLLGAIRAAIALG